jgi:hypothetical protein
MDLYDIAKYGGATVGGLGMGAGYQTVRDMYDINKMASMGNYSSLNPMPEEFMSKLRGAWTPSSTFQKTGYPTGLKNWFFSRSSPQHFGPVEKIMKWGKAGLPYLKQGAKFLRMSPLAGFASDALLGTDITASSVRDASNYLPFSKTQQGNWMSSGETGGGNQGGSQGGGGQAAGQRASAVSRPSGNAGYSNVRRYGRARGGIASLWQR